MIKKYLSDPVIKFFVVMIGIIVIAYTLKELADIFLPFVIAYFLYFTFSPLNDLLTSKKIPLFVVILIDLAIIVFIVWGISSFLIDSFLQFGSELPDYYTKLNTIVRDTAKSLGIRDSYFKYFSIQKIISAIDYKLVAADIFLSGFSILGSILFVLFFYIFIVTGHQSIYESVKKNYVNTNVEPEIDEIKKRINETNENETEELIQEEINDKEIILSGMFTAITQQIQRYIIAKVAVNLLAGIVVTGLLSLLGVDFPIIWGSFVFLFNFIPTIGSAIALVLPVLMSLIQFGSVGYMLLTAGVIAGAQTLFFNILEPMIIGKRLNLNPLLILFSVLIWGYIWGLVGMLLSVPLTAVMKIIIANSRSKNLIFINNLMSKDPE